MANYLSEDLRIRVIEAVEAGSSRRGAAARFGVSFDAIRWVDVWRRTGRTAPYRGTDRGRGRVLLAKVEETPDITRCRTLRRPVSGPARRSSIASFAGAP